MFTGEQGKTLKEKMVRIHTKRIRVTLLNMNNNKENGSVVNDLIPGGVSNHKNIRKKENIGHFICEFNIKTKMRYPQKSQYVLKIHISE